MDGFRCAIQSNRKDKNMKVTDRVKTRLKFINSCGCVLTEQIAKEDDIGYRYAAKLVETMVEARLIKRMKLPGSQWSPLVCTPSGCKAAGDDLAPLSGIRVGTLEHDLRVVDIGRALKKRFKGTFESARRVGLRRDELALEHLPDGILHRPDHDPVYIEWEKSLKSPARLKKIIEGYAANLLIKEVWYMVEDRAIGRAVAKAAAAYPFIKVVGVTPLKASNSEDAQ
jgi:hypothetical protein